MQNYTLYNFNAEASIVLAKAVLFCIFLMFTVQAKANDGLNGIDIQSYLVSNNAKVLGLSHAEIMRSFYEQRNNERYWMGGRNIYSRAEEMYSAIDAAWTHGLNPRNYHYSKIYDRLKTKEPIELVELELLLTDAFIKYSRDLSGMRVNGQKLELDNKDWKQRIDPSSAVNLLNNPVTNFEELLSLIQPQGQTYKALQRELVSLVKQGPDENEHLLPIRLSKTLRPGDRSNVVPVLREYFNLQQPYSNQTYYDDDLARAVLVFQNNNQLKTDAIIGSGTLEVLNRTNLKKIEQVIVNLERLRWVNTNRGDKFVIVNIPSAKLWAIDNGRVAFEMPVVVGLPSRPTLSFNTYINGVRLNPDWTVPPTIKKEDILPQLMEDPNYLADKGMELIQGYGEDAQTLDPLSIDWANVTSSELNSLRMVQVPGDHNPLGRYRILMPNRHNIYLHDTNHPELFDKDDRTLSSGCVRMKYPRVMIDFILENASSSWNKERVDRVLSTYKKTDITLNENIPISLLYYTVWLDDQGNIQYGSDIYGWDINLLSELTKIDGVFVPVHNER